jgi:ribosome-associated translation inhibitor RaiA
MRLTMSRPDSPADVLDQVLQLGAGFGEDERRWVLEALEALAPHLARWNPADVAVRIAVKHRDSKEQQVTLQADLPGYPPLVAKAVDRRLDQAVAAAKRELIRQIEDEKTKREPKENRHLREKTVRRP